MLTEKYNKINVGANIHASSPNWLNLSLLDSFKWNCEPVREEDKLTVYKYPGNGAEFIARDVIDGLPFPDNSLDGVYSSHFIEHLDFEVALLYFKEAYRVLRPGGVMRTICPDLGIWIEKLYTSEDKFFETYKELIHNNWYSNKVKNFADKLSTKSQIFNSMFFNWGHKWMWDEEALRKELSKVGFRNITRTNFGESKLEGSAELETNSNETVDISRKMESIYLDAIKD